MSLGAGQNSYLMNLLPPTPAAEDDSSGMPFPSTQDDRSINSMDLKAIPSPRSSAGSTPSILGRLPSTSSVGAPLDANYHSEPNVNISRIYRRSLDAVTMSLPSFSRRGPDYSADVKNSGRDTDGTRPESSSILRLKPTISLEGSSSTKEHQIKQVSFDNDRVSLPNLDSGVQSSMSLNKGSPELNPLDSLEASKERVGSRSPSRSRSRLGSPLQRLQHWSFGLHRNSHFNAEDPFVVVNPFKSKTYFHFPLCCVEYPEVPDVERLGGSAFSTVNACEDIIPVNSLKGFYNNTLFFFRDTIPRQLYLHFLLRFPAMYFTRVARIFEEADVSRPDIQRMIDAGLGRHPYFTLPSGAEQAAGSHVHTSPHHGLDIFHHDSNNMSPPAPANTFAGPSTESAPPLPHPEDWTPLCVSPALVRFKVSWELFIDSLLREWKTLNLVSALLASGILSTFQVQGMASDPVTSNILIVSLICSIMSLSYGCVYVVRFSTMRTMYKASRWAEEARQNYTLIWWNVWVLLAMPAVWLAWSMAFFIVGILSFVWRTGSVLDPVGRNPLSAREVLVPRIIVTSVVALGLLYMAMIVRTLSSYGSHDGIKGILSAGSPKIGEDVIGVIHADANRSRRSTVRARDIDAAMERRGRERTRGGIERMH